MSEKPLLRATKAKPWYRRIKVNKAQLLGGIAKFTANAATNRWPQALAELPQTISAVGLKEKPAEIAWMLIERSISRAVGALLKEYIEISQENNIDVLFEDIIASEDHIILELDEDFFSKPHSQKFVRQIHPIIREWLISLGYADCNAKNISDRFSGYLASAFDDEWRSDPKLYQPVLDSLSSPFSAAASLESRWFRNKALIARDVDQPVFQETFGLRQIYVYPRACWARKPAAKKKVSFDRGAPDLLEMEQKELVVVDLKEELLKWIKANDHETTVKAIAGGPGSGKSSFCKMFCNYISNTLSYRSIIVPLHMIDMKSDFVSAMNNYLEEVGNFNCTFLELCESAEPLIVILDGLDELEMQGQYGLEVAQQFMRELVRASDRINSTACRVKFLVSGRDMSLQVADSDLRKQAQLLTILPYFIPDERRSEYLDANNLLITDQRDIWWKRYSDLTNRGYQKMPDDLRGGEIGEVTAQPLLNYLASLAYHSENFELSRDGSVNALYEHLVEAVHERGWAKNPHPTVRNIPFEHFMRLLEEVAVAVWHGDGRKTTLRSVEEHCKRSSIGSMLPDFQKGSEAGISSLLLAFYFRQQGQQGGEKTFEFTHKSFGEYLASHRIVRLIKQIAKKRSEAHTEIDSGWSTDDALHQWLSVMGAAEIDKYLLIFVRREITRNDEAEIREWGKWLADLYQGYLSKGWPMERQPGLLFKDQQRWARNAEEGLLACLNACSRVTKVVSAIRWPSPTAFGEMLKRLQGQRSGPANRPIMDCLGYLDLRKCCLDMADLYGADLRGSNLSGALCHYTNFDTAVLDEVEISGAVLTSCRMHRVRTSGANFSNSVFYGVYIDWRMVLDSSASVSGAEIRDHYENAMVPAAKMRSRLAAAGAKLTASHRRSPKALSEIEADDGEVAHEADMT